MDKNLINLQIYQVLFYKFDKISIKISYLIVKINQNMEALANNYKNHLDQLKAAIQDSELLNLYLDNETDDLYKQMVDAFEPHILELYNLVAAKSPLQLISLETELLDSGFEGLFLPRILGYSVLRSFPPTEHEWWR